MGMIKANSTQIANRLKMAVEELRTSTEIKRPMENITEINTSDTNPDTTKACQSSAVNAISPDMPINKALMPSAARKGSARLR